MKQIQAVEVVYGWPPATDLLLGRNLLLAVLWALMLSLPSGEKKEPSASSPEVL